VCVCVCVLLGWRPVARSETYGTVLFKAALHTHSGRVYVSYDGMGRYDNDVIIMYAHAQVRTLAELGASAVYRQGKAQGKARTVVGLALRNGCRPTMISVQSLGKRGVVPD
jgi:hypothetical protein